MSVSIGQLILLALALAFGVYVFLLRSPFSDRIAMLILAVVGVVLIVRPALSTDFAHLIGIGRGTDLVFYLFIVFCLFRFVSTSAAARRQEQRLAEVVRELALRDARPPKAADSSVAASEAEAASTSDALPR